MHFAERHRTQARVAAGVAEQVLPRIANLLRWKPAARIQFVVLDSADFANGFASPLPFNYTMVFLSPPDEGELLQNREWLELVLTHEIFHIVHLDMVRGGPLGLRRIFGRVPFLFPNALQPLWILEGLAVQAESDPRKSEGRLGNSYFEGMMRAEASRGFRSLSEVNAGGRGFPLNRDYLYGAYFFAFLQERYGEQAISKFIENYSDNVVPFRVHTNPVVVTGKNMNDLWTEYQGWLKTRFPSKVDVPQEGEVLERNFSITSPVLGPDGTRWYVRYDGYSRPKLVRQGKALRNVELDSRLAAAPGGGVLLAQAEICKNYNYYYDVNHVAPDGRLKRLSECGRFRFAGSLDDGRTVAVRVHDGQAEIVVVGGPVLYRTVAGESVTGLAVRGASVVATTLREGKWSLVEISGGTRRVLVSDGAIKHSPRYGERDEVFFVADYGKVFNVWSLGRGGQLSRWTHAANGIREISAPRGGEMLLTTIEPDGDALRVYRLPQAPLEQRQALTAQEARPSEPAAVSAPDRPYSPWRSLLPRSWLPLIELADGAAKLGVFTFGQDALALHQYVLAPQFEFTQQEMLGTAAYIYDRRHALFLDRRMSVKATSDDDDEVRAYTIEETAQWISTWRHLALSRRFYWGLGGALERERLHQVGGPTLSDQDERVLGLVAGVDTRRTHWLSEGPSHGQQLRLFAERSYGFFSGDVYRADWRLHFGLWKSVLSLRWNEAWGERDAEPFQLGGSDSDPPTLLPVLNQREFALRGYRSGDPDLTGHRARIGTLEWRVPLKDVDRHAMVPPLGLNRVAMNLFFDVGDAWARGAEPDYRRGVGIELMSEVRLGYLLAVDLRLGLADGLDERGRTTAYLRAGRSF